jgi:hypothetical protein
LLGAAKGVQELARGRRRGGGKAAGGLQSAVELAAAELAVVVELAVEEEDEGHDNYRVLFDKIRRQAG